MIEFAKGVYSSEESPTTRDDSAILYVTAVPTPCFGLSTNVREQRVSHQEDNSKKRARTASDSSQQLESLDAS